MNREVTAKGLFTTIAVIAVVVFVMYARYNYDNNQAIQASNAAVARDQYCEAQANAEIAPEMLAPSLYGNNTGDLAVNAYNAQMACEAQR
jgi:hypothetical protein